MAYKENKRFELLELLGYKRTFFAFKHYIIKDNICQGKKEDDYFKILNNSFVVNTTVLFF